MDTPQIGVPGQRFHYFVAVDCATLEQADQVINERINIDEEYGFDYTIRVLTDDEISALSGGVI